MNPVIKKGMHVSMRYVLRNSKGEVLEDKQNATYQHGGSAISPLLQAQLEGLKPGEAKTIVLKKGDEDADDDFTFDVIIDQVRETPLPMTIHLLSGFLGSGKTTAIEQACRLLQKKNIPVAVITNDQGAQLVDGGLFTQLGIPSREVINGCFCCNYGDLDTHIRSLVRSAQPAVVFAESVGSCTDLVATVLKPLLQQHPEWRPTVSVFADARLLTDDPLAFDPAVRYIYWKQLEEAQVIVITKIDLLKNKIPLQQKMQTLYPGKTILYHNSFDEADINHWLSILDSIPATNLPSLEIDYDLYGAGEAKLAWLDQQLEIHSPTENAGAAAIALFQQLSTIPYPIGHLKCLIDKKTKLSFTATGSTDRPFIPQPAPNASLLINARVLTEPAILSNFMAEGIKNIEDAYACTIHSIRESCFQPGYPRPAHRIG
jgi:Ni2+-binding GTPase involved in maturation of urease and hydrogenase